MQQDRPDGQKSFLFPRCRIFRACSFLPFRYVTFLLLPMGYRRLTWGMLHRTFGVGPRSALRYFPALINAQTTGQGPISPNSLHSMLSATLSGHGLGDGVSAGIDEYLRKTMQDNFQLFE